MPEEIGRGTSYCSLFIRLIKVCLLNSRRMEIIQPFINYLACAEWKHIVRLDKEAVKALGDLYSYL